MHLQMNERFMLLHSGVAYQSGVYFQHHHHFQYLFMQLFEYFITFFTTIYK